MDPPSFNADLDPNPGERKMEKCKSMWIRIRFQKIEGHKKTFF